ncbi:amino acid adenylation domain-containing protein [Xenorhabdus bovienii]|uniref:non-ribosomal peptide synthetase n=2 Tax=Xenorhabdus bovienii TaxID=40576 RepID=UPI0023B269A0|nr:non-ribosomal peptide synthetase [Xenorhabdus bovienii]MDE9436119.1 amino acid adenylation domain-containing protein [Xenorhabdus bovienii]MDE9497928.1 amino acid adenylation domain-containing protein [Xenorhabdus bovienii]
MTDLIIPTIGEGTVEVIITQLLKQPGDWVERDEPLYELETDKSTVIIESDCEGTLVSWRASQGEVLPVGSVIAVIEEKKKEEVKPENHDTKPIPRIPPKTRRYAQQKGINDHELIQWVNEELTDGITTLLPCHIDDFLQQKSGTDSVGSEQGDPPISLSSAQRTINRALRTNMTNICPCWVVKPLTVTHVEKAVMHQSEKLPDTWVTPFQIIAWSVIRALAAFPMLRARAVDTEHYRLVDETNLGIAFQDTENELRTFKLSFDPQQEFADFSHQLSNVFDDSPKEPLDNRVTLMLSYTGAQGATFAIPLIVPPAQATLFVGAAHQGTMNLVLGFNHFLLNGVEASAFLTQVINEVSALCGQESCEPENPSQSESSEPLYFSQNQLMALLADLLECGEIWLHEHQHLSWAELGVDSLKAVTLAQKLSASLKQSFSPVLFWRHTTPQRLVSAYYPEMTPELSAEENTIQTESEEDIAIVGMAFRLPGAESSQERLWEILATGESVIQPIPGTRFTGGSADVMSVPQSARRAGLLADIQGFDADFFGISPREARLLDPQQRLLLELSWQAIEDSGYNPQSLSDSATGVFIGSCSTDYRELLVAQPEYCHAWAVSGTLNCMLANRLSWFYNLNGPSIQLDTACSSGLTALVQAVDSIRAGRCQQALVGAVNLLSSGFNMESYHRAGMLSTDGHCRVFDAKANGFVRGEGGVCLLLKTRQQARQDGNPIYGYIRSAAINHGGRANSLTSPNPVRQADLLSKTLRQGQIALNDIHYIEAHGTGTRLGDPIEFDALQSVYGKNREQPCYVGSIKANIGHLEGAAGLAGIVKILLMFQHRLVVPAAEFNQLNPEIDPAGSYLKIAIACEPLPDNPLAAISSFGLGGSNAHVVLAAGDRQSVVETSSTGPWYFPLSAISEKSLRSSARLFADWLEQQPASLLPEISWTLQVGRATFSNRRLFVADSIASLCGQLRSYVAGRIPKQSFPSNEVGKSWEQGESVKWEKLWTKTGQLRRIRLPHYSFQHQPYWITQETDAASCGVRKNETFMADISRVIHLQDAVFTQHQVDGNKRISAAMLLDMAATACPDDTKMTLQALHCLHPCDPEKLTQIDLVFPDQARPSHGEFRANDSVFAILDVQPFITPVPAVPQWDEASKPVDVDAFYNRLAGRGVVLGKQYRQLRDIHLYKQGIIASLNTQSPDSQYPQVLLLDAVLHLSCALLEQGEYAGDAMAVIASVSHVWYSRRPLGGATVVVKLQQYQNQRACLSVWVKDKIGTVLYIGQLCLALLSTTNQKQPPSEFSPPLRTVQWRKREIETNTRLSQSIKTLVVIGDPQDMLANAFVNTLLHQPAQQPSDITVITLPDTEGTETVTEDFQQAFSGFLQRIYFFCSLPGNEKSLPKERWLAGQLRTTLLLLQQYQKASSSAELCCIFNGLTDSATETSLLFGLQGGVVGLMRSLLRENNNARITLLDLPGQLQPAEYDRFIWRILAEPHQPEGQLVALRRDGRWEETLVICADSSEKISGGNAIQPAGHYVILGGSGGIGSACALHLAKKYRCRLSLVGRRRQSDTIDQQITALHQMGGEGRYYTSDVTQSGAMATVLQSAREAFGPIHGVIYAIPVVENAPLSLLTPQQLDKAFLMRLQSVQALLDCLESDENAFVALFGSIAGILGSRGGGNYAAANSLIHFAAPHWQNANGRPVYCLSWGLWQDIGLARDFQDFARMQYPGLETFSATAGAEAFEQAINNEQHQCVIFAGMPQQIREGFSDSLTIFSLASRYLQTYAIVALAETLQKNLIPDMLPAQWLRADWYQALKVLPHYHSYADVMLDLLQQQGWCEAENPENHTRLVLPSIAMLQQQRAELRRKLLAQDHAWQASLDTLDIVLESVIPVIQGSKPATAVLFPDGSTHLVSTLYSHNPLFDAANQQLAQEIADYLSRQTATPLRVLEIGAGTGSSTTAILSILAEKGITTEYWFTDVSAAFLRRARERYGDNLTVRRFDLEQEPTEQEIPCDYFDVVIASNVIHATRNIDTSLQRIHQLLRPTGDIFLLEMVCNAAIYQLIFGLTEGWWHFQDPAYRHKQSPLLSQQFWHHLFTQHGWSSVYRDDEDNHPGRLAVLHAIKSDHCTSLAEMPENKMIIQRVTEWVREVMGEPQAQLDPDLPLVSQGFDSILLTELATKLQRDFGQCSPTLLYEYPSLTALAQYFSSTLSTLSTPVPSVSTNTDAKELRLKTHHSHQPLSSDINKAYQYRDDQQTDHETVSIDNRHRTQKETVVDGHKPDMAIAIIGVSGVYPDADNLTEFARLLSQGKSAVRQIPASRWSQEKYYSPEGGGRKSYTRWGCFIRQPFEFDYRHFRITPRDAALMDPQERLFLQVAWHTLEDAGYSQEKLSATSYDSPDAVRVGVFVGMTANTHLLRQHDYFTAGGENAAYAVNAAASVANRVSYHFNLKGPSQVIDTMCSSSLTAIHHACVMLRQGECDMALAGGVNLYLHPNRYIGLSALNMPSKGDQTRAFGQGGDGFVPGEGVGAVLLKPLDQARADGDFIYSVIRGSAINHGGFTGGYTVPNPHAQQAVIRKALQNAQVAANTIDYVEAHGTGTELGDPIEVRALSEIYAQNAEERALRCRLGSVKTNIGHCEAAAGIAGLTKIVLQLCQRRWFPSLHAERENSHLNLAATPLELQKTLEIWPERQGALRRSAVSSFGAGGVNIHMILEEAEIKPAFDNRSEMQTQLLVLSAPTPEQLAESAKQLYQVFRNGNHAWCTDSKPRLCDIAWTLQTGRNHFAHRVIIAASDYAQALIALEHIENHAGKYHPRLWFSQRPEPESGEVYNEPLLREIAASWLQGSTPEWHRLHHGQRYRVPLPGLSFLTTLCDNVTDSPIPVSSPILSGYFDEYRPFGESDMVKYVQRQQPLLQAHRIQDEHLLPGAVLIEGIYQALKQVGRSPYDHVITALSLDKKILPGQEREALIWRLTPDTESFRLSVHWREQVCMQAEIVTETRPGWIPSRAVSQHGIGKTLSHDAFYQYLAEYGYCYGAPLRVVQSAELRDVDASAMLDANDITDSTLLSASLIDGLCQVAAGLLLHRFLPFGQKTAHFYPRRFGRIQIYGPVSGQCQAHVSLTEAHEDHFIFDLALCDVQGKAFAWFSDFTVVCVSDDNPISPPIFDDVAAYTQVWQSASNDGEREKSVPDVVLLSGDKRLALAGWPSQWQWALPVAEEEAGYLLLLDEQLGDEALIEQLLTETQQWLTRISQRRAYSEPVHERRLSFLVYLHRSALGSSEISPIEAALAAFLHTLNHEMPFIHARLISGSQRYQQDIRLKLVAEMGTKEHFSVYWVRYNAMGERQKPMLAPVVLPVESSPILMKKEGIVLIVGGLKGLGYTLACQLLEENPHVSLVLWGRSSLDETLQKRLDILQQRNAKVRYSMLDVTDHQQVEQEIAVLRQRKEEWRGIIYCAGMIDDAFIINKSRSSFRQVFNTKVAGVKAIDQALGNTKLDYFLLYSSLAVVVGNEGQSDYAAANAWLQQFALRRNGQVNDGKRYGATLAIGWPMMADGGMTPPEEEARYLVKTYGFQPMPAKTMLRTLGRLLVQHSRNSVSEFMLFHGDKSRWLSYLNEQHCLAEQGAETLDITGSVPDLPSSAPLSPSAAGIKTSVVQRIAQCIAESIGLEPTQLRADEPLEELGVDSLSVTRISRALESQFGTAVKGVVYQTSTLQQIVDSISLVFEPETTDVSVVPEAIQEPADHTEDGNYWLSMRQTGMLMIETIAEQCAPYAISLVFRLQSRTDLSVLKQALTLLLVRHDCLQQRFTESDEGYRVTFQKSLLSLREIDAGELDFSALLAAVKTEGEQKPKYDAVPFQAVLWNNILRNDASKMGESWLQITTHHAVLDGISVELLIDDLELCYLSCSRQEIPPAVAGKTMAEFLQWEHQHHHQHREQAREFVELMHLADIPPLQAYQRHDYDYRGIQRHFTLGPWLTSQLKTVATHLNTNLYTLLLGAFSLLIARQTGQKQFAVALPVYGRPSPEYKASTGAFINVLPLPINLTQPNDIPALMTAIRNNTLKVMEWEQVAWMDIVAELRDKQIELSLPEVTFSYRRGNSLSRTILHDVVWMRGQQGDYALGLEVTESEQSLQLLFNGRASLFDDKLLQENYHSLLQTLLLIIDQPTSVLPPLCQSRIFTLDGVFEEQVRLHPNQCALIFRQQRVSFSELDHMRRRVAAHLLQQGIKSGDRVGVSLPRSAELVAILLGILTVGAAYVPVDPAFPEERKYYILKESGAEVVISDNISLMPHILTVEQLMSDIVCHEVWRPHNENSIAYVMFTSGSTGKPKGIQVMHGNILHCLQTIAGLIDWQPHDVWLATTTISFDISVLEIFLPLVRSGGVLVMAPDNVLQRGDELADMLEQQSVTVMQTTPSAWQLLIDSGWKGKRDLRVLCGGEPLSLSLKEALLERSEALWNAYGPTETTIWSTFAKLEKGSPVVLGDALGETLIEIVDKHGIPVASGETGELLIGGAGVTAGYFARPELNETRFINSSPFINALPFISCSQFGLHQGEYYRTGDLVRRQEGQLIYVGRNDDQIKLRGHRIEPGEIERVLSDIPGVKQAVVLLNGTDSEAALHAIYLSDKPLENDYLQRETRQHLPDWMMPDFWHVIGSLPLTPNKKVDRAQLKIWLAQKTTSVVSDDVPSAMAPVKKTLYQLWCRVLSVTKFNPKVGFFENGGNSWLVNRLYAGIKQHFPQASIRVVDLFTHPFFDKQVELLTQTSVTSTASVVLTDSPVTDAFLTDAFITNETTAFSRRDLRKAHKQRIAQNNKMGVSNVE